MGQLFNNQHNNIINQKFVKKKMSSDSEKQERTPMVEDDVRDNLIIFTEAEIRKLIRYFRRKLCSARVQQPSLVNRLKRIINTLKWHESVDVLYFQARFIKYLLRVRRQCKGLSRSVGTITRQLERLNMTQRGNTSFVRQD